jgi:integrase
MFQEVRVELASTPIVRRRRVGDRVENVSIPRSRRYVLDTMGRVRQLVRFAVAEELLPGDRLHALEAVPDMPSELGDRRPRRQPVPMADYRATLEHLTPATRAIVEFICLTGCRPDEAAALRLVDIEDRDERVWKYRPARHKNQWRGHAKVIPVGPKAQAIVLEASRGRETGALVFDARQAVRGDRGPILRLTARKPSPRVKGQWTTDGIRRAIVRAAELAGVPKWTTYQLRHLRLQEVRRNSGREAAQAVAGHNRSTMVDHYAPPSWEAAERDAAVYG